jgi:hypothetical protein
MASKKRSGNPGGKEFITQDTRQDIITLVMDIASSAAEDGVDLGDPCEKIIEKLDDLLFKLTQGRDGPSDKRVKKG